MKTKNEQTVYTLDAAGDSIFLTGAGGKLIRVDLVNKYRPAERVWVVQAVVTVGAEPEPVVNKNGNYQRVNP